MTRTAALGIALALGVLAALVIALGVTLWTDAGPGGPASAEWILGLIVGVGVTALLAPALVRASDRGALDALDDPTPDREEGRSHA